MGLTAKWKGQSKKISGLEMEHKNYPACTKSNRIENDIATVGKSMAVPRKIKLRITKSSSKSCLGMCPKALKARTQTGICIPMFIAALHIIAKGRKQLNVL